MTVEELQEIIKDLPNDAKVEINSVWDSEQQEYTPTGCSGFYHKEKNTVFLTPNVISI